MTKWNYRPCRIIHEDGSEVWDIRSFFYDEDGTPRGWSQNSAYPFGETLDELKSDLSKMFEDLARQEVLTLYVYTCDTCGDQDARTEKERTTCPDCLSKQSNE